MKTILSILFASLLFMGCSEDDPAKDSKLGCMTGIPKAGAPVRTFYRCGTYEQFLAGDNVAAGGTDIFDNYTNHQWAKVSDCSKCD